MDFLRRKPEGRLGSAVLERKRVIQQAAMDWVNKMIKTDFNVEEAGAYDSFNNHGQYRNKVDPSFFAAIKYPPPIGSPEETEFLKQRAEVMEALGVSEAQLKAKKWRSGFEQSSDGATQAQKAVYDTTVENLEWIAGEIDESAGGQFVAGDRYLRINPVWLQNQRSMGSVTPHKIH